VRKKKVIYKDFTIQFLKHGKIDIKKKKKKCYDNITICVRDGYIMYIILGHNNEFLRSFINCENENIL
jgi:hypothetical protein